MTQLSTETVETQTVRQWAKTNGYEVKDTGRLPARVLNAYRAAYNLPAGSR